MLMRVIYFVCLFIATSSFVIGGNFANVNRGERPPIDFSQLKETDYHNGVLKIKFHAAYERHLEKNPVEVDKNGIVRFNLSHLDRLNEQYGVKSARLHFASPALKNGFTDRHKAWGFHLWYQLELDEKAHIPTIIDEFSRVREIEHVVPELTKKLIGSHDEEDFHFIDQQGIKEDDHWTPNDPQFSNQWHYHNTGQQGGTPGADISLPAAWGLEKGNSDVIVAIIDGGIDHNHNDLAGNMWEEIGYNFVFDSPSIEPHNHGTHVAGTISALNNNNLGVSGVAGGSGADDGVRLMSCQVFTQNSSGGFHIAPVYAADNGAAISQNSWGYTSSGFYEQDVLDAIDYFNEHGGGEAMDGGITIFAAGNSDSSADYYPGYYEGCFSVAATNNQDAKSWYSNYGDWIDISAPGGETSTVTERGVLSTLNDNQYGYYQGTSMACPHVSGVVALMLSSVYGEFAPQDVEDILVNTVDNHYGANPGYLGQLGAGRLNAYLAVALSQLYLEMPSNPSNFQTFSVSDEQIDLSWDLNDDNQPVMLAWSTNGNFGIPEEGEAYQVGDNIPGGGTVLLWGDDESFSHLELNAATPYYYKLWSVDDENNFSLGRTASEFTQCGVTLLPVMEAFDSSGIPYCWDFEPSQGNWEVTTSNGNPAPAMQFSWNPQVNDYTYALQSPPLEGTIAGDAIALEFDLMLDNYATSTLEELQVEVYDGQEWHVVMTFDNSQGDIDWDTYFVDITSYALDNVFKVRFNTTGENSYNINHWVIDNFMVYSFSCPQPVDLVAEHITSESVDITWEPVGDEMEWEMVYGTPGFDPDVDGTLVTGITTSAYTLEELSVFTSYQVYVRADCGEGDLSLWTGPLEFSTLATCPAPGDVVVSQVNSGSAMVSWEPVGQETIWQLVWGPVGFNPETDGTWVDDLHVTEYELTNLEGVTSYDVYVRAYCQEDDLSLWVGPVNFTTTCDIFTLPFAEYFDGSSLDCWSYPDGQGNWGVGSTYPPPSSESGTPHATFNWSPSITGYSYSFKSPLIESVNSQEPVYLDFVLFLNNYNNNSLEEISVEYKLFDQTEWTLLESYNNEGVGSGSQEFVTEELLLAGAAGNMFQVRFRAHGENSFTINGWSLDDVEIYQEFTQCYEPINLVVDNITTESAVLNWDSQGSETLWHILWGQQGFDVDSEGVLIDDVTAMPHVLEGLIHSTDYEFYIKAICDDQQESNWAGPAGFTTQTKTYLLTVSSGDNGTIEPEGEIEVEHGNSKSFTIIPDEGYHISEVTLDSESIMDEVELTETDESAEGLLELNDISSNHSLHVAFAVNTYTVNVTIDPEEGGSVTGAGTYDHGSQVTLNAEPADNFAFLAWMEYEQQVSDDAQLSFEVENDRTFVAVFQDVTAVSDLSDQIHDLTIYPNPASDKLWVEITNTSSGELVIGLYNVQGQTVTEKSFDNQKNISTSFELDGLQPGVYMVSINQGEVVRKVIIK